MANDQIKCPKCGTEISVDQAIVQKMVNLKVEREVAEKTQEIEKNLMEDRGVELKLLQEKLNLEKKKREEAEKKELEVRSKEDELKEKEKNIDLKIARKMEEQNKILAQKAAVEAEEKYRLIIAEKEKKLEDQKKLNEEMNRKLHQGSMQTQGEVLELTLENQLKKTFHLDQIEEVPKGISGADILHKVIHPSGQTAGMIAWETKRTKGWEDKWIEKLKDDARTIKADACVLVSDNLPKKIQNAGLYQGAWVCNFSSALGVAALLRHGILTAFSKVLVNTGKDEKKEAIYDYLCSPSFKQKVEVMIENSNKMLEIIETEKKWMTKKWATEEMRVRRLQENTLKLWGDIQGIAGSSLPDIEILELQAAEESIEETPKTKKINDEPANPDQTNLF